ncbi:MAG: DUF4093 domain-containing protein [Clostridia bacterium]|nr:DUF4093 domain-containing protein [Clostridia bacterium]
MIRVREAVVVEGKYDKITLENVIDGLIIPVNGFSVFNDKERCELLRTLAKNQGVVILTDSDSAGQMIRSYLKKICAGGKITQVYIPALPGKEKRKRRPGKEGLLGVEGMSEAVLAEAFRQSGVSAAPSCQARIPVTKTQLYLLGLSGRDGSHEARTALLSWLKFPTCLSANAFLDLVNSLYGKEEFERLVAAWRQDRDKK